MIPTGRRASRSAGTASPCDSSRWWETRSAVGQSRMPGALTPSAWPRNATTHGSLWVIQRRDVAELAGHQRRVLGEPLGRVARGPAAGRLARLRQVPVVERRDRLDAALAQALAQPPVAVHAGAVAAHRGRRAARAARRSRSGRTRRRATPSGRGPRASGGSGRRRRRRCRRRRPRPGGGRRCPRSTAAPVLVHRALDLVGGHGDAEAEVRRERADGADSSAVVIPSPRPR